ncbi:MAG: DUF4397 domain-containing protein [Bdellovibrionales bacterium]|nr:DUF4397 domain-containing protein [Bdellovibrionales bacterium]
MKKVILVILLLTLFSCGGGGGGGGESSSSNDSVVGTSGSGVRVLHGALDAPPFDLFSNALSGELLQRSRFGGPGGYSSVPVGEQVLSLAPARIGGARITKTLTYHSGERYTFFVRSPQGDGNATVGVFLENPPPLSSGQAALRVYHGVSKVDLLKAKVGTLSPVSISQGQASTYVILPAGEISYLIRHGEEGHPLLSGSLNLAEGEIGALLVAGEPGIYLTARYYVG